MSSNLSVSAVSHATAQGHPIIEPTPTTATASRNKIQYFAFAILLGSGVLLGCLTVVTVALPIKASLIAGSSVATISSFAILALFPKKNGKIVTEPPIGMSPNVYTLKQKTEDYNEVSEQTEQLRKEQTTKRLSAVQQPIAHPKMSPEEVIARFPENCINFTLDHNSKKEYDYDFIFKDIIAARGPQGNTMNAFWEMALQTNTTVIAMLTDFPQCYPYLPVEDFPEQQYGSVIVKWKSEQEIHTGEIIRKKVVRFVERVFEVTGQVEGSMRNHEVHHIHVENWPDVSVIHKKDLLKLVKIVDELQERLGGVLTIHCQMGVGRSGTFLDALMVYRKRKNGNNDPALPLYTLNEMREKRPGMIHKRAQFRLCVETDLLHQQELLSRTSPRTTGASGA